MGQALYRKYRSRSFDEVVGQDHITKTLQNAKKEGRISHAYLFTGPRGVGKTSVARILAHEVNDLPYSDDSMHLDIIEIDAASNRRIDEIRDLRERVHIAPTSTKYKVYIIDEVHMLTREAFNALLKTLEEPPSHCIFILATTEAHKLPDTIISRTQRFNFKPVGKSKAATHLAGIAKKEKIDIEKEALELLAEHGDGSFRDSIGLLDQLSGGGSKITESIVREMLGLPPAELIDDLINETGSGASDKVILTLEKLWDNGSNPVIVSRQIASRLRAEVLKGNGDKWLTPLLRQLVEIPVSANPAEALELCLLEAASNNSANYMVAQTYILESREPSESAAVTTRPKKPANESRREKKRDRQVGSLTKEVWPEIVTSAKHKAASLYTALRLAIPQFSEDSLTLLFEFPLHQKKVMQAKNLETLGIIIEEVTGQKISIKCIVDKDKFQQKSKLLQESEQKSHISDNHIAAISNIFGSAEVLES